jgi:hypothetical protein
MVRLMEGEQECNNRTQTGRDRRGQDTRPAPFRRKAEAFPWLHAGASVGARAARKRKASKINASNSTIGHSRPKAPRP